MKENSSPPPTDHPPRLPQDLDGRCVRRRLGTLELSRNAHAAGSDIIKVGMIGCGGRNSGAAGEALTADPGARLVAMCDIFRDRVEGAPTRSRRPRARRSPWMTPIASPGSMATST